MANLTRAGVPAQSPLTPAEQQLLREFNEMLARLRQAGLVRSGNATGDIGEWLVVKHYGLELHPSCRNEGFEGYIDVEGRRYRTQVKVHNASIGLNQLVGNPDLYDLLVVLVGPDSTLRDARVTAGGVNAFHVYVFEPADIKKSMHSYPNGTYSCAKTVLHAAAPNDIITF